MKSSEIRKKYLKFMEERGHKIVSSASLLPENDPTTLFTGSGMQPIVPYLLGEPYPGGEKRIANSQKCFRSGDIEEVGDNRHTTFFEMLGNWSLGDYFKKEQIEWIFEFLTKELELDPKKLYVSVYRGNEKFKLPKEEGAVKLWQEQFKTVGIKVKTVDLIELRQSSVDLKGVCLVDGNKGNDDEQRGRTSSVASLCSAPPRGTTSVADNRIFFYPDSENWWSRAGEPEKMPEGEIGGPDSEIFWDFGAELKLHENSKWKNQPCHPACDCGRFMEIGNNVFMQYKKVGKKFEELANKNIDFGGGLERLTAAVLDMPDVFLTDLFELPMKKLEEISGRKYELVKGERGKGLALRRTGAVAEGRKRPNLEERDDEQNEAVKSAMRVILDHIKGATFLINDGAEPSNKDQGYFTRRLIRRAVRFGHQLGIEKNFTAEIAGSVIEIYQDYYTDLADNREMILNVMEKEENKFRKTLQKGLKIIMNYQSKDVQKNNDEHDNNQQQGRTSSVALLRSTPPRGTTSVTGKEIFDLYQTYGFPIEMSFEELEKIGMKINKDKLEKEFEEELQKHKDLSRTASAGKFKGGLAGNDKITTQLHTVTHLMLAGLRKVLGKSVTQKGSNITPERIRFDFSFDRAMTDEKKQAVEKFVNDAIQTGGRVELTEMPKQQAMDEGVVGAFWEKYPEQVKVYTITAHDGTIYSRELCGGPHIKDLSELKNKTFKIIKEKSSGAGVRRIKAVVE